MSGEKRVFCGGCGGRLRERRGVPQESLDSARKQVVRGLVLLSYGTFVSYDIVWIGVIHTIRFRFASKRLS